MNDNWAWVCVSKREQTRACIVWSLEECKWNLTCFLLMAKLYSSFTSGLALQLSISDLPDSHLERCLELEKKTWCTHYFLLCCDHAGRVSCKRRLHIYLPVLHLVHLSHWHPEHVDRRLKIDWKDMFTTVFFILMTAVKSQLQWSDI